MPSKPVLNRHNANTNSPSRQAVGTANKPTAGVGSASPAAQKTQAESPSTTNFSGTRDTRDSAQVSTEAGEPETSDTLNGLLSGLSNWDGAQPEGSQTSPENARQELSLGEGQLLGRRRNPNPEQVTQLQELLNSQGGQLQVDGRFGLQTEEAVRSFQRQHGLTVDGVVGPETLTALNRPRESEETSPATPADQTPPTAPGDRGQVSLAAPNLSTAEQFEHYRRLIEANGGQLNAEGATVLGLRGLGADGQRHDGRSNIGGYDDSFVVLNQNPDGSPSVQMFQGATHANQYSSGYSSGPDAQGNTISGVAMMAPGNYSAVPHSNDYRGRGPSYHVRTLGGSGDLPAYRDRNRDGEISGQERSQAEAGGYTADQILFHGGGANAPISIGCQTLSPSDMRAFSRAIGSGGFNYTLLDANDAVVP